MSMSRKDFTQKVTDMFGKQPEYILGLYKDVERTRLEIEWRSGGVSGGNCWGDSVRVGSGPPESEMALLRIRQAGQHPKRIIGLEAW